MHGQTGKALPVEEPVPELPDVEVFRRYFDATSLHKKIRSVAVRDRDMLEGASPSGLEKKLAGRCFRSTRRHGKYLFAEATSSSWLVLHFGMTGFLKYFKKPEEQPGHERLRIRFSNGYSLVYDCQRKLGELRLIRDPDGFVTEKNLGPDALSEELDPDAFIEALSRSRGSIKSALMNQDLLAGLGNVYSDEILFQAGVDPRAKTNKLDEDTLRDIFRTMRKEVLPQAIEAQADPSRLPDAYMIPRRQEGGRCPKCNSPFKRVKVSGRTAYLCGKCQRRQF